MSKPEYSTASAIEVCTIEAAKKKGLYSTENYYVSGYEDLKTYHASADANRNKEICSASADGVDAYLFCSVEHNNIALKRKGKKCVTVSCPTGWQGINKCTKPLEDAIISKRAHCDERWYDWFTVPNYHLGNRYQADSTIAGKCYNPCPSDHVPHFTNDPVDGSSFGMFAKGAEDKCVPRNQYMGGKYYLGSDFCPMSWIYRIGATPQKLTQIMNNQYTALSNKVGAGQVNADFQALSSSTNVNKLAQTLYKSTSSVIENVEPPSTSAMQQACRSLQTPERITEAYNICKDLKDNEENILSQWQANGDSDEVMTTKLKVLKQACSATFCDPNNDAADVIGQNPLCYETQTVQEGELKSNAEEVQSKLDNIDGVKTFKQSLPTAVYIIMIAGVVALGFVLWRYIRPVLVKLWRVITRVPSDISDLQDKGDESVRSILNEIEDAKERIANLKRSLRMGRKV